MKLEAGTIVNGSLRLVRPIGEGGMGSVWLAEHSTLEREVAVKFLAAELAEHPDAVERFTREAKVCARMQSPHVVKIFDYATPDDALPYIVMERLEGEDLEERVSRQGPLSRGETVDVVVQLGKALGEAHACGIVHRDIKPENVFLTHSGRDLFVKMLDFGIAKQSSPGERRVTISGTTVGTPTYMSPEQILSARDVDHRCDLWALAVVAYFALTGRVPFDGPTFGAVCIAIDRGYQVPASTFRPELPRAVEAWFQKAFARKIDERFGSLHEMTEAFATAMEARPPFSSRARVQLAPLSSPALRVGRGPQRPRTLSGAIAIVTSPGVRTHRGRLTTAGSVLALAAIVLVGVNLGRRLTASLAERASVPLTSSGFEAELQVPADAPVVPPTPPADPVGSGSEVRARVATRNGEAEHVPASLKASVGETVSQAKRASVTIPLATGTRLDPNEVPGPASGAPMTGAAVGEAASPDPTMTPLPPPSLEPARGGGESLPRRHVYETDRPEGAGVPSPLGTAPADTQAHRDGALGL